MTFNSNKEDSGHLSKLQEQYGEEYEDAAEEVEDSGKREGKQTKESIQKKKKKKKQKKKKANLAFYLGVVFHLQSLQAPTVSLTKACPSSSLI